MEQRYLGESILRIGVTGHRLNRISSVQLELLTPDAQRLFGELASLASLHTRPSRKQSPVHSPTAAPTAHAQPLRLWVCSALAEGADQHLARLAVGEGWSLHALLPFDAASCIRDCAASSRPHFAGLLQRARHVTELPGQRQRPADAYRALGHALVDSCDLLLAVWDGGPPLGPGGTAEVVAEALQRQVPVIHLSTLKGMEPALLWRQDARDAVALDEAQSRPCTAQELGAVVQHIARAAA